MLLILSYHLSAYLAQHAWIEAIPEVKDFVGRETELKRYRKMLQKEGLACKTVADVHDALNEATQAKKYRSWAEQLAEKMRRERADEESVS